MPSHFRIIVNIYIDFVQRCASHSMVDCVCVCVPQSHPTDPKFHRIRGEPKNWCTAYSICTQATTLFIVIASAQKEKEKEEEKNVYFACNSNITTTTSIINSKHSWIYGTFMCAFLCNHSMFISVRAPECVCVCVHVSFQLHFCPGERDDGALIRKWYKHKLQTIE